jgi:hypothetical protein
MTVRLSPRRTGALRWRKRRHAPRIAAMNEVLVLHCARQPWTDVPSARALASVLPYAHRLELERRDADERDASLAGLALVLRAAARLRGQAVDPSRFRFLSGSKPYLDGGPWFSVSHCRSRVVVAVSDACEVGVDVEDSIAAAGGNSAGSGVVSESKLERWTATEAALKTVGAGLRSLRQVELEAGLGAARIVGVAICLQPLALAQGCVAHLATLSDAVTVTVEAIATPW